MIQFLGQVFPSEWAGRLRPPAVVAIGVFLLSVCVTLCLPNYYASTVKILPVEAKSPIGTGSQLAAAASAIRIGLPGQDGSDASYVDILESRWLRLQILDHRYEFVDHSWRWGRRRRCTCSLRDYLRVSSDDQGIGALKAILLASRDMKSRVLTITAETKSPELSQQIASRASDLLEEYLKTKSRTRGSEKAVFAQGRLNDAVTSFAEAEAAFNRFLSGNRNYQTSLDPAVRLAGARLELQWKLRQQLIATLTVSHEQALMDEKNDMPILNVLDPANLPAEKSRPSRGGLVLLFTFLAGTVSFGWYNRQYLKGLLIDSQS